MKEAKIFINTDEEITFVAEKIKTAKEDNIALVIPDRAMIFSSLASLKLLKKMVDKYNKRLIVVTMDEIGKRLLESADIPHVSRVTEINPEMWDKIDLPILKNDEKEEFIPTGIIQPETDEPKDEIVENKPAEEEPEVIEKEKPEEVSVYQEEPTSDNPIVEKEVMDNTSQEPQSEDEFEFVFGKDINDIEPQKKNVVKDSNGNERIKEKVVLPTEKNYAKRSRPQFDFSKIKAKAIGVWTMLLQKIKSGNKDGSKTRKRLIIAGAAVLFLLLATGVFAYWGAPSATITVNAKNENLAIDQEIFVSPSQTEVKTIDGKIFVPSYDLSSAPQSVSNDAPATGIKKTGTKTTGKIEVTNVSSTKDVNIQKGSSIFTCKTGTCSGLTYVSLDNATIPKRTGTTPSFVDVNVQATDIGEKYNFSFPTQNIFDLAGDDLNTVSKSITSFSGGTSKDIKVVSASDVDTLTKQLTDQVKNTAIEDLKSNSNSENILIESTIDTKITDKKLDVAVGQQADTLNISLTLTATAKGFKKSDLQTVTNQLLQDKGKSGFKLDDKSVSFNPQIKERVGSDQKVLLSITARLNPDLNAGDIKKNIKGKTISEAQNYLKGLKGIENATIIFSPGWVPEFLRHIPFAEGNITLKLEIK